MASSTSHTSLSRNGIVRSVIVACGAVILLFVLFEVVELLWLSKLDMEVLHAVYVIRGLFISLIAVMLVGWLVVRASNPLLTAQEWIHGERPIKKDRLKNFITWFIAMRWVAIFIASALVVIVVRINQWLPMQVWWPLVTTIGALALLNALYAFAENREKYNHFLLPFQAYADLIILTILLHFSGGIENPLTLMMLIHVFIAGIVLSQKHLYAVTTTAIFLLVVMAAGEATGIFDHYTLNIFPHFEHEGTHIHAAHMPVYVTSHVGLMVTIFLLTAYFIGTIMDRIRHDERQLEIFADQSLEQRQLIEKALETTGTGLCVCDERGKPLWTNRIWESWFGAGTEDCVACKDESGRPVCVGQSLKDGKSHVREITKENTDSVNKSRIYQITTAPLLNKDGNYDHSVSLATDITDQKKAQAQMLKAGKLAAVGELAGKVAHEVNNPIAIISAKCRLLLSRQGDQLPDRVSKELVKITDAADRVSDIAKGLLSYCRPSIASRKALDLRIPIENALSMIEQSARKNGVKIDNTLSDPLPPVKANANEMQQVFLNIFLNALDAMPAGGDLLISAFCSEHSGDGGPEFLTIIIQDTGSGIPVDLRHQIFEPFFTTKEEGKGTGLGLSICVGLVRSHDGRIDISSKPNRGTEVTIRLPISKSNGEETHG